MVVRIRINVNLPLINFAQNIRPFRQLPAPVHDDLVPDFRLLVDCFAVEARAFIEWDYRKLRAKPRDGRASECELRLPIYYPLVFLAGPRHQYILAAWDYPSGS